MTQRQAAVIQVATTIMANGGKISFDEMASIANDRGINLDSMPKRQRDSFKRDVSKQLGKAA